MDFPSPPQQPQSGGFNPVPPQPTAPQPLAPQPITPPQPVQIPVQSHPGAMGTDDQVYTMPEKFIPSTQPATVPAKQPKKMLTIILVIVIVLAVLGIIGGVLFYVLRVMNQEPVVTDARNAVVVNTNNTNTTANVNANENANLNDNANANANANVNENTNDNTNVVTNANANSNLNANDNANANVNVNTNANTNTTTAVVPVPSKDTDEDSLTNDEEKIWGTKADLPDTDSDGYTDGVEILAGYDPTNATSAGRLADNATLVGTFANGDYNYTILYPAAWLAEGLAEGDNSEILLTPNTLDLAGQYISITVVENPTGFTAMDWYVDTADVDEEDVVTFTTFAGATGVFSTDGTTAYLANTDYIYAVSYRYGNSPELFFPTTFQMVAKSVVLTEPKKRRDTNANDNENANTNTN